MADTLRPDRELQRFNRYKEKMGDYFRFRPRSAWFNIAMWGVVPVGLCLFAYNNEGLMSWKGHKRHSKVLTTEYVPRDKDL
ncbi:hypothetical protein DICA3_B04654 [Diutina catenulata]